MTSPLSRSLALAVIGISAALVPSSLFAQQGTSAKGDSITVSAVAIRTPMSAIVDSAPAAGPRVVRAGITMPVVTGLPGVAPSQGGGDAHVGAGSIVAMMGVGAAGILVGTMIGGNGGAMIAVGGGVIGLIGLFRYLR